MVVLATERTLMLAVSELKEGHRYLVTHKSETQHYARTSVMDFMAEGAGVNDRSVLFSARPNAGTQAMPREWIVAIQEVPMATPIHLNRDARKRVVDA
jgi:hypothetical protein